MEERSRRIVDSAVELAEQGGFEAVRLRDVASRAGVALGTLYRRFRSKEDLLLAALHQELGDLRERVEHRPPEGDTPLERAMSAACPANPKPDRSVAAWAPVACAASRALALSWIMLSTAPAKTCFPAAPPMCPSRYSSEIARC